jgi:hypothetical protein
MRPEVTRRLIPQTPVARLAVMLSLVPIGALTVMLWTGLHDVTFVTFMVVSFPLGSLAVLVVLAPVWVAGELTMGPGVMAMVAISPFLVTAGLVGNNYLWAWVLLRFRRTSRRPSHDRVPGHIPRESE